jgi:hypothetical protein
MILFILVNWRTMIYDSQRLVPIVSNDLWRSSFWGWRKQWEKDGQASHHHHPIPLLLIDFCSENCIKVT